MKKVLTISISLLFIYLSISIILCSCSDKSDTLSLESKDTVKSDDIGTDNPVEPEVVIDTQEPEKSEPENSISPEPAQVVVDNPTPANNPTPNEPVVVPQEEIPTIVPPAPTLTINLDKENIKLVKYGDDLIFSPTHIGKNFFISFNSISISIEKDKVQQCVKSNNIQALDRILTKEYQDTTQKADSHQYESKLGGQNNPCYFGLYVTLSYYKKTGSATFDHPYSKVTITLAVTMNDGLKASVDYPIDLEALNSLNSPIN